MDLRKDDLARDLDAAVQTRKELGAEYEAEIVDSFLARLDARLDAQVDARVEERVAERLGSGAYPQRRPSHPGFRLQMLSLVMGVPLSAIATESAGPTGLLVCWAGIVAVNISSALAGKRGGAPECGGPRGPAGGPGTPGHRGARGPVAARAGAGAQGGGG